MGQPRATTEGPPGDRAPRCAWAEGDPLLRSYHDSEWGVPEHDARKLWETLMLEAFQAGLSWTIILRKREGFRRAFCDFDPGRVARFRAGDVARLIKDPSIVRSKAKIEATIAGANAFLRMQRDGEDLADWAWRMAGGRPIVARGPTPTRTPLSEEISVALRERGFRFVGPVTVYAWMQAVGIVNDHTTDCFRRAELAGRRPR
jgi:DNA-3-methyladenine glycosylase I